MAEVTDYYEMLGIDPDADPAEIKRAFITLAKQYADPNDPEVAELKKAYAILSDPQKRERYNQHLEKHYQQAAQANGNDQDDLEALRPKQGVIASGLPMPDNNDYEKYEYLTLESSRNYGTTKFFFNGVNQSHLKNGRFADIINMLGWEGWDMVGIANIGGVATFIFKRATNRPPDIQGKKAAS